MRWTHSDASPIFYCNPEIGQVAALRPLHEVVHRNTKQFKKSSQEYSKECKNLFVIFTGGKREVRQNLTKRYVFYKSSKSISFENREGRCNDLQFVESGAICERTSQRRIPNWADIQIISLPRPTQPLTATLHKPNQISIAHHSVADHFTIPST